MSVDENLSISIDDAALTAALAKLDQALTKKEALIGTPTQSNENGIIINESEQADAVEQHVDEVVAEGTQKLDELNVEADNAKAEVDDVIQSEGLEISGVDSATNKILRRIPLLREAQRIYNDIEGISKGNIASYVAIILLAYSLYNQLNQMIADQKQQKEEYKALISQAQGFTSSAQFNTWQNQQNATLQSYRSRPIIK